MVVTTPQPVALESVTLCAAGSDAIVKLLPWIGLGMVGVLVLAGVVIAVRRWLMSSGQSSGIDLAAELREMRKSMTEEEYAHVRSQMMDKMRAQMLGSKKPSAPAKAVPSKPTPSQQPPEA